MRQRLLRGLLLVLCAATFWMTYDNVFSDDAPITALAEQAACAVKPCKDVHKMTRMERTPLGQSYEFTWRAGVVKVSCRRAYVVAGPRVCAP